MSDPTPIPPALLPDAWAAVTADMLGHLRYSVRESGEHAVIALANAARRDDDPGKLKQADVALLRGYAEFFRRENLQHPRLAELDALADKLASLLPPE